jgi:hypothetical protein
MSRESDPHEPCRTGGAAMITGAALFGVLLSMGAAICGALAGAGPSRHLLWGSKPLQRMPSDKQYANQI